MIVLPYGDHHTMGGEHRGRMRLDPLAARPAAVGRDAGPPPWRGRRADRSRVRLPALRRPAVRPRDAGVPPVFVVRLPDGAGRAAGCRRASTTRSRSRAVERRRERRLDAPAGAGADRGAARSPRHRAGGRHGWLAALRDPVLAPALALCTARRSAMDRGRSRGRRGRCRARCSTSASARCSGDRRSATSPSGGCTSPRSCSPPPTSASSPIARRVGYDSEEAFSRAFKRGASPSHWRGRSLAANAALCRHPCHARRGTSRVGKHGLSEGARCGSCRRTAGRQ